MVWVDRKNKAPQTFAKGFFSRKVLFLEDKTHLPAQPHLEDRSQGTSLGDVLGRAQLAAANDCRKRLVTRTELGQKLHPPLRKRRSRRRAAAKDSLPSR